MIEAKWIGHYRLSDLYKIDFNVQSANIYVDSNIYFAFLLLSFFFFSSVVLR